MVLFLLPSTTSHIFSRYIKLRIKKKKLNLKEIENENHVSHKVFLKIMFALLLLTNNYIEIKHVNLKKKMKLMLFYLF